MTITSVQVPVPAPAVRGLTAPPGPTSASRASADPAWLTVQVRPAGSFGRRDVGRLRALLDALSACASIVVIDLGATRLRSPRAVAVIEDAARRLDRAGGCLVCVNAEPDVRECLGHAEHVAVLPAP